MFYDIVYNDKELSFSSFNLFTGLNGTGKFNLLKFIGDKLGYSCIYLHNPNFFYRISGYGNLFRSEDVIFLC